MKDLLLKRAKQIADAVNEEKWDLAKTRLDQLNREIDQHKEYIDRQWLAERLAQVSNPQYDLHVDGDFRAHAVRQMTDA